MKTLLALIALIFCGCAPFFLQKNIERDIGDKRVLLQGFYWESYRHGHPDRFPDYGPASWYTLLAAQAPVIRDGRFDLIWLPPPSYAGDSSAGYNPKVWYRLDNSYGSEEEHLTLLRTLLAHGVEPIADIVINHRDGLLGWAHFTEPAWGTDAVCRSDEAFTNEGSEVFATPEAQRGQEEEFAEYAGHDGTTYAYPALPRHRPHKPHRPPRCHPLPEAAAIDRLSRLALRYGARLPRPLARHLQPRHPSHLFRRRIRLGQARSATGMDRRRISRGP